MSGAHHPEPYDKKASAVDRYVGLRIRLRRRNLGMAQQQLADQIGMTYQQVHKYEKGISRIAAAHLHAIALALETDVASFFEHVEPVSPRACDQDDCRRLVELTNDVRRITNPKSRHAICVLVNR